MTNAMQKVKQNYGLENVVDSIFDHSLRRFFDGNLWEPETSRPRGKVPVNVRESENQYEVDVIAPGCRKENFQVAVKANELSVSFTQQEQKDEQNEKAGWVRNEYIQRSFSRSFTLDETVDTANISATYSDGILHLVLPKNEKARPKLLSIDVK
ncbi:MAG: Hsp20/alpha crystallin family protein [Chitinophagaceae bacterium]